MEFLDEVRRGHTKAGDECVRAALDDDVCRSLERFRHSGEQVDSEGLVGEITRYFDLFLDLAGRTPGHSQRSKTARVRNGGTYFGICHATHASEQNGILDA